MIEQILVAINGSEQGSLAADYALALAKTNRASLRVVYVTDDNLCHKGEVDQLTRETTKQQFNDYIATLNDTDSRRALKSFSAKADLLGIDYTPSVRSGQLETEIVAEARDNKASLVILGDGCGTKNGFIPARSTGETVRRNCPCPVLIAPRD